MPSWSYIRRKVEESKRRAQYYQDQIDFNKHIKNVSLMPYSRKRSRTEFGAATATNLEKSGKLALSRVKYINTRQGHSILKAHNKGYKKKSKPVNILKQLNPDFTVALKSYGHDADSGRSMKLVAWAEGCQDIRQMVFLPALYNYINRENDDTVGGSSFSSVFFKQYGEQRTLNELMRKSINVSPLAAMQMKQYYDNGVFGDQLPIGLAYPSGGLQNAPLLDQHFQMLKGYCDHVFTNNGNSRITIELYECAPRRIMKGCDAAPVDPQWTTGEDAGQDGTNPGIVNDPLNCLERDYYAQHREQYNTIAVQSQAQYGNIPAMSGDLVTKVTDPQYQWITSTINAVGARTGFYPKEKVWPLTVDGRPDPMFKPTGSCKLLNYNYHVAKPIVASLEPGAVFKFKHHFSSFSFKSSEFNQDLTDMAYTMNTTDQTIQNAIVDRPNYVPKFTRFLIVRAFSNEIGVKKKGPFVVGNAIAENDYEQVGQMGGSYTHTQYEYYKCKSTFYGHPTSHSYSNNCTDGLRATLEQPIFSHINVETNEVEAEDEDV